MSRITKWQWLGAYLVNVFSFELRDELVETLVIGFNADGANEFLDVRSRGRSFHRYRFGGEGRQQDNTSSARINGLSKRKH
jgi:hypothetical protein